MEDITDAYVQAWKLGLKCVAIYRDGSKRSQPLNTAKTGEGTEQDSAPAWTSGCRNWRNSWSVCKSRSTNLSGDGFPRREQRSLTNSISRATRVTSPSACSRTAPGEMFITMAKEGSTIGGLMDSVAALTSISLQYGVPLDALVRSLATSDSNRLDSRRTPDWTGLVDHRLCISLDGVAVYSGRKSGQRRWATGIEHPGSAGAGQAGQQAGGGVAGIRRRRGIHRARGHAFPMTVRPSANRWRISWRTRRPAQPAAMSPCATAPVSSVSTAARAWLFLNLAAWPSGKPLELVTKTDESTGT